MTPIVQWHHKAASWCRALREAGCHGVHMTHSHCPAPSLLLRQSSTPTNQEPTRPPATLKRSPRTGSTPALHLEQPACSRPPRQAAKLLHPPQQTRIRWMIKCAPGKLCSEPLLCLWAARSRTTTSR